MKEVKREMMNIILT